MTDGRTIHAVRYATDGDAPTLHLSPDVERIYAINPAVAGRFGDGARAIVSEPIGSHPQLWPMVPQNSSVVVVEGGDYEVRPFRPAS